MSTPPPANLYQPLDRVARLSDRVASQIQRLIVEHELRPGARLPAERELGEAFGVSRTVIREAIKALAARGLVDVQAGNGTLVRAPSASMVSDALALVVGATPGGVRFRDAHQIRCILEPEMAAIAAEQRTEEDLAAIRHELRRMTEDEADWQAADVEFHAALARATHNPLFGIMLHSIQDILREVRALGYRLPETRANGIQHHTTILAAVEQATPDAARRAMIAHLAQAERTMRRAVEVTGRAGTDPPEEGRR